MSRLVFAEKAWEEYLYWQKTDKKNTEPYKPTVKGHH